MTDSLPCAICGESVPLDMDYIVVSREARNVGDRNQMETYYLHKRCASSVTRGWSEP